MDNIPINDCSKEYNIKLYGEILTEKKSYLIKIIKEEKYSIIKIKSEKYYTKVILKKNKQKFIINLIDVNDNISENDKLKADCFILEYNLTDIKSLNNIKYIWHKKVKYNIDGTNLIYLIGIKDNLYDKKEETFLEAKNFTNAFDIKFLTISNKSYNDIKIFYNIFLNL